MPGIIDKAQSAFVPGRQISDNILLAQELFRGYGRETGLPKCALKLDLNKGLRQGDPISPYLFTLAMNVFSSILNQVPTGFQYHWKCKELKLTHLFFADDTQQRLFWTTKAPSWHYH
ncbi:hypothetical protein DCAR_0934454 [Daucus carota subsp. sativus]|uniref:Reverse transcriptase domain-containing protein n=1 Tax=Daucus carota subsp. sativus TaxID=79200 RepID=A0AAF0XXP2_DAUCS|nr:hypothetical protein DCAR_0934438 [Daucus carota subsp. sativus]WOH14924.1 hypothetical protein DCAR_0934454 [Daucus carota subsp. sativus]